MTTDSKTIAVDAAPFIFPTRVYWEDTDAGGVVYHAQYVAFLERTRTEWLRARGYAQEQLRQTHDLVFAVRAMRLDFLRPARLDDLLQVSARIHQCKRASVVFAQTIERGGGRRAAPGHGGAAKGGRRIDSRGGAGQRFQRLHQDPFGAKFGGLDVLTQAFTPSVGERGAGRLEGPAHVAQRPEHGLVPADGDLDAVGQGLELAVTAAIYRTDGTVRRAEALQAHPLNVGARIVLNPADAQAAGVADGQVAKVGNGLGTAALPVVVDARVAAGAAWIESGYGATAPLGAGRVTVVSA